MRRLPGAPWGAPACATAGAAACLCLSVPISNVAADNELHVPASYLRVRLPPPLSPKPRFVPRIQRTKDRNCSIEARGDVDNGDTMLDWAAADFTRYAHQPAFGLQNKIIAWQMRLGAFLAIARDGTAHDLGRMRAQPVVAKTPFVKGSKLVILDQHVTALDQVCQHRAAFLIRQIKHDAAFVAVNSQIICSLAPGMWRPPSACIITARRFNFDHIGPHITKDHGAKRPRKHARQVKDPYTR